MYLVLDIQNEALCFDRIRFHAIDQAEVIHDEDRIDSLVVVVTQAKVEVASFLQMHFTIKEADNYLQTKSRQVKRLSTNKILKKLHK